MRVKPNFSADELLLTTFQAENAIIVRQKNL